MCVHFKQILTVYTLNSHLLTLKAHITKSCMLLLSAEIFEASSTNSVDPEEQSDLGPHCLPLYLFSDVVILLVF